MALDLTQFKTTIQTKIDGASDSKEMFLLGKAIEATVKNITFITIQSEGDNQIERVVAEGDAQVDNVQQAAINYARLDGAVFTGDVTFPSANLTGALKGPGTFVVDPAPPQP